MNKAILFGMWLIGNNDYEDVKRMYEDWEQSVYSHTSEDATHLTVLINGELERKIDKKKIVENVPIDN